MSLWALSGSLNSGWLSSLFSPLTKDAGILASLSTDMAKAAITEVRPMLSSAARSVEFISRGVIWSSVMPVKPELKREDRRCIIGWSTDTGRCTSLFFTELLLSITTIIKVLAST